MYTGDTQDIRPQNLTPPVVPVGFSLECHGGPGRTWSNLVKMGPDKQEPKVGVYVVAAERQVTAKVNNHSAYRQQEYCVN